MSFILACTPSQRCDAKLAIAAARFGETGILDLGYAVSLDSASQSLASLTQHVGPGSDRWGLRWDMLHSADRHPAVLRPMLGSKLAPLLLLEGVPEDTDSRRAILREARQLARRVFLEAHSLTDALDGQEAGYDGIIIKGHEAGGWVGEDSTFLLLQRLHNQLRIPYWVRGGIGPDTASAALLAGAAGIVLAEQLWLTLESPFTPAEQRFWRQCDGSETLYIGRGKTGFRLCSRIARSAIAAVEKTFASGGDWMAELRKYLGDEATAGADRLVPLGQEIGFAARLADSRVTVADVLRTYRQRVETNPVEAIRHRALTAGSSLAKSHGTLYPILQGPMTRVSDVARFSQAVAENGALPFLALALMSGPEVRRLLDETSNSLAGRPWGVGILGFVPPQLRKEQLQVITEFRPPYAIIAGGRPSQAQEMEQHGTKTYLHVPSPGLLDAFLREGARRFIFEGRECGGHVGPRSSFALWQSALDVLLATTHVSAEELHIVFAGGIHDALSAALVSTLAAPLSARGMKIGVLMGTAYLFTPEAVLSRAITAEFHHQALQCQETVLLESGVGHATRAARTPYSEEFLRTKEEMLRAGTSSDEVRLRLELLNVGRLRIAAKGVTRNAATGDLGVKGELTTIDEATQQRDGLYMIGQVATLRDKPLSMAELHAEVSEASAQLLEQLHSSTVPAHIRPSRRRNAGEPIAIVGIACLFPGAENLRKYWQNICNRVDAIQEVPPERWRVEDYFSPDFQAPDRVYSRWGGFLGKFVFDPLKWQIPPASLASIEPVQLLSLEVASQAFADAGYEHRPCPRERTSVLFAVAGSHDLGTAYCIRTMLPHYLSRLPDQSREAGEQLRRQLEQMLPEWTEDTFPGFLANVVAGRIARELNLGGPNYVVDAACASSLAAFHGGIEQLRAGTSDLVLVGGADLTNNAFCYMSFAKTYALSPRGRSRPFDDSADGIGLGEGVAAMLLKRLSDAERDGDRIYAVIKGIGASGDGKVRTLTAPSPKGQILALERAYEDADVPPTTISLIEAHGTGTPVGDSSELTSLQILYSRDRNSHAATAIGSVKSMIGHTKTVAGLAGMIKTALALKHRVLPPTIGVDKPTTKFDFSSGPFYLNTETRPWIGEENHPRRAGVSAFGFGGTNFHVVLEEYTGAFHSGMDVDMMPRSVELFLFRRNSRAEVIASLKTLRESLHDAPEGALAELAAALVEEETESPTPKKARLGIVAATRTELSAKLDRAITLVENRAEVNDPSGIYYSEGTPAAGRVCFLYPGQGSQRVGMLSDLVSASPYAHSWFTQGNRVVAVYLAEPLSRLIYPPPAFDEVTRQKQGGLLKDTRVAQPALGLVEVFATELLKRYGVEPDMVAGHSYGELTALWAAGCFDSESLLRLSALRGRFCSEAVRTTPGGMAAVAADRAATEAALRELRIDAAIANLNAPDQTIVAGSETSLAALLEQLPRRGVRVQRIDVSAPFHTSALRPASDAFAAALRQVPIQCPSLPVYSNTTAQRYSDDPGLLAATLVRQLHEPVRFEEQVRRLHADGARVFLEIGPDKVLTDLVRRILKDDSICAIPLSPPDREGWTQLAHLLARLAALGLGVSLPPWFQGRGLRGGSVAEVLARARRETQIKPTDWIIQAGRAEPVTPLPGKRRPLSDAAPPGQGADASTNGRHAADAAAISEQKTIPIRLRQPAAAVTAAPSLARTANVSQPVSEVPSPITQGIPAPMITAALQPSENSAAHAPLTGSEMFARFQATTSELFQLQMAQQHMMERYLETQERMFLACLQGSSAALVAPPATLPRAAAPVARPAVTLPGRGTVAKAPPQVPVGTRVAPPQPKTPFAVPSTTELGTAKHGTNGHAPPVEAPAADSPPPPTEVFRSDLLQIVSERTGYPIEMLDEKLPLEASLGIDSIKTVEIFSKLKKYHVHFQEMAKGKSDEELLASFTKLKTLKDVIDNYEASLSAYLERTSGVSAAREVVAVLPSPVQETIPEAIKLVSRFTRNPTGRQAEVDNAAERYVLRAVALAPEEAPPTAPRGRYCLVLLGDVGELTEALLAAAAQDDNPPILYHIVPGVSARHVAANRYEADFAAPESIRRVRGLLMGSGDVRIGGVLNCLSLSPEFRTSDDAQAPLRISLWNLNVIKEFLEDLTASVVEDGGWFLNVTPLGGKFGLEARTEGRLPLAAAGTLGIVKTLAREHPRLRVRNVDIDPNLPADVLVPQLLREGAFDGPRDAAPARRLLEVGLNREGRWRLELQKAPLPADLPPLALGADSVVLVLGGAQGVTASISKALAATGCHVVIAGLSPMPAMEPEEFAHLERPALRQMLLDRAKATGQSVLPADIERKCNRILKDRQIRATLKACEEAGGKVEYHTLDVRDADKFAALLQDLYERFGRIDGVVHGAGIIEDKLLADKSVESFSRVFTTKVDCALTLARTLRPEHLQFMIFFSSVTARFGNPGQADYAAANEYLNKLASELARQWPARVVSVLWGPWDGGMVAEPTRDLRYSYAQVGIGLIPTAEGAAAALAELRLGPGQPGEVLISASVARMIEMSNQG